MKLYSDDPSSLCTRHAYYLQGVSPERALLVGIFTFKQFLSLSEGLIDFAFQQTVLAVWIFHLASLNPKTDFELRESNIRCFQNIGCLGIKRRDGIQLAGGVHLNIGHRMFRK